jgi:hypothetical protein
MVKTSYIIRSPAPVRSPLSPSPTLEARMLSMDLYATYGDDPAQTPPGTAADLVTTPPPIDPNSWLGDLYHGMRDMLKGPLYQEPV